MKKILIGFCSFAAVIGIALADMANTATVLPYIDAETLNVSGVATVATLVATSGSIPTVAATTSVTTPKTILTASSQNVTNGQVVTLTGSYNVLTGIGQANAFTNTVTLAPAVDGTYAIIAINSASSNLIAIADSGRAVLNGAIEMVGASNTTLSLIGRSTNWVELGRSVN